jgi:hypothetical protein
MFGLTRIDLGENIQVQFSEETGESTHFRLINVICDEILICRLLNERTPSRHQLNIL